MCRGLIREHTEILCILIQVEPIKQSLLPLRLPKAILHDQLPRNSPREGRSYSEEHFMDNDAIGANCAE